MFLHIVRYNIHYRINRILYLTAFFLIFIGLTIIAHIDYRFYKKMNDSIFVAWCLVISLTAWGTHLCMKRYTIIGECWTDHHSITLKYKTGMIKRIELKELLFIDGGYKGKCIMAWNILFAGRNTKEGANNFLVFNNDYSNKIQILLASKKQYKAFLNKLSEFEAAGIKTQQVHYARFGFRNVLKKLKPSLSGI